jgi:steroid 5-alpha reductase family enzyme
MVSDLVRGIISNTICLAVLFGVGFPMKLLVSAAVSLGINWLVFLVHALPQNSEKFFDATGSLTYLALIGSAQVLTETSGLRRYVSSSMVVLWCVRLGSYLLMRILQDGKDARFDDFKKNNVRFLGVWSIQALWCFLVASPALVMITSDACGDTLGIPDYVGWAVWVLAFLIEVIADKQKSDFRKDPANKGKFITTGLWAYSRHPNYFGEISMWVGICISGSTCFRSAQWLAWLSPLTTLVLLTLVSGVPLLEATGDKRWGQLPEYQHYMKHTPCIFPALCRPPPYSADNYVEARS